ncbi:MAG: dockerin type I domain-containing protein [Patescibacteria group bacterium]
MIRKKRPLEDLITPLVERLSSFEAILVEVIICLIIFISVLTPKVAQASTPGKASLAVSWDRPGYAKVTATYTDGTDTGFKCSGLTSCTIGPFWGTPVINYVVKDASTNYPIKDGSIRTFANSVGQGFATISWNWTYELQVYPENAGSCTNAGSECRKANYVNNNASIPQSYVDLLAGRNYRVIVCLTACTFYAPQLKSYTETTGTPATALAVSSFSATCNAYGLVNADFTWNRATGRSYDLQYLDKSTDANWPTGVNVPFGANPNKLSVTDLFPNQAYHFRINSRIYGNHMWDTSDTVNFTVPNCTVPNKLVTAKAVLVSPIATNPTGMVCSTTSGVVVNFKWQAATINGGTYDYAYIDYSVYNDNFVLPYKNSVLGPSATIFGGSGFSGGINYYWRLNYHVAASNLWVTSDTGSFTTPSCVTPPVGGGCTFTNSAKQLQKYGDVSGDGRITTGDATLVKRYVAGVDKQLMGDRTAADVNGINGVDSTDADLINQYYFKIITTFPVCSVTVTEPLTCSRVDVSGNGVVDANDGTFIRRNYSSSVAYNAKYDLNNDKIVDALDLNIVYSPAYYGKNCFARTGAVNTVCTALAPGSIVDVTFNWMPANGDPGIKTQWLDYDTSDHGTGGGWPAGKQLAPGVNTWATSAFPQGTTYFWRVNTQYADGSWKSSKTPSTFTTADCTPVPTNLLATPATTEKLADGTPCASGPYSVAFKWDNPNKGVGWYIDVTSTLGFPPGGFSNKLIDGNTILLTTGSDLNVPMQFRPGLIYYWRIFNGVKAYGGNSVSVAACPTVETPGGRGVGASSDAIKNYIKTTIGDRLATVPTFGPTVSFGKYLWGLALCEGYGTPDPDAINPNGHYGLYQYSTSSWNNFNSARGISPAPNIYAAFDQIDTTAYVLERANWDAFNFTNNWPECNDGNRAVIEWTTYADTW